jgi:hypothetical protein
MADVKIKDNDARALMSYLLNNDSVNVAKLVNVYMESAYSSYSNEKTQAIMEGISIRRNA